MKTLLIASVVLMISMPVFADRNHNRDGYRSQNHHSHGYRNQQRHYRNNRPQYRRDHRTYVYTPYYKYGHSGLSVGGYIDDQGRWRTTWGITFD